MYSRRIKAGTTDVSVVIRIVDSGDGTPETGVVFNTSGIDLEYRRELAASVDITEATLADLTTAHADGGFLHIGNGYYRLDLPDAACAAGATGVLVHGVVTGMIVMGCYIELVAYDPYDTVRLGLTALPNAAAAASGGLYIRGTGAGAINQDANGRIDVNVAAISTDSTAADNCELMFDGTGYAGGTAKLGVDVVQISSDATAADNCEAMFDGNGYAGGTIKLDSNLVTWRGTQPAALSNTFVQGSLQETASGIITATSIAADAIGASELAADAVTEIVTAIKAAVVETNGSITLQQAMSVILAAVAGETTDAGDTFLDPGGNATRISATTNGSNERTAIVLTPSA